MVFRLKIECVSGMYLSEKCVRIIAMDDSTSLFDLHSEIQDAVSFGRDHPFEFYTANTASSFAVKNWITYVADWDEKESAFREKQLKDIWPLGRRKLYYWFDFGDRWIFEIRKLRSRKADASISPPQVLERIGPNPEQYPILKS